MNVPMHEAPRMEEAGSVIPAGFWIRFIAAIVDGFILMIVKFCLGFVIGFIMAIAMRSLMETRLFATVIDLVVGLSVSILYYGYFYSRRGATPGKSIFHIKVFGEDGQYLSFGKAILREIVGKFVSTIILFIGFFMVAFRADKRGLHDLIAGSYVYREQ